MTKNEFRDFAALLFLCLGTLLALTASRSLPQGILGKPKAKAEKVEAKAKPAAKEPVGAAKGEPSKAALRGKADAAPARREADDPAPEQAEVAQPAVRVEPGADTTIIFDTWPDAEVWLAVNPAKFPQAVSRDGLPYADRAWLSLGKVREWRARVGRGTAEMWLAASRADGTWTGALRVMVAAGETKTVKAR